MKHTPFNFLFHCMLVHLYLSFDHQTVTVHLCEIEKKKRKKCVIDDQCFDDAYLNR